MSFLRHTLGYLKIFYIYLAYYSVALTGEEYYIWKANTWADIGRYHRAIRNYEKALKESEDSIVRAAMAWCYLSMEMHEEALENYRKAYEDNKQPHLALGLAWSEYQNGNVAESKRLVDGLNDSKQELDSLSLGELEELESALAEKETGILQQV